jgi:hypothetical protein
MKSGRSSMSQRLRRLCRALQTRRRSSAHLGYPRLDAWLGRARNSGCTPMSDPTAARRRSAIFPSSEVSCPTRSRDRASRKRSRFTLGTISFPGAGSAQQRSPCQEISWERQRPPAWSRLTAMSPLKAELKKQSVLLTGDDSTSGPPCSKMACWCREAHLFSDQAAGVVQW